MENYHGIIVNVSQKDQSIFSNLKIIGLKKAYGWILYRIEVKKEKLNSLINKLQKNMKNGFYFHLYRKNELIVAFKEKTFKITTDKSTWKEVIDYGKQLNIPEKQLDFYPCKIEDETY